MHNLSLKLIRTTTLIGRAVLTVSLVAWMLWSAAAIYYLTPELSVLPATLCSCYLIMIVWHLLRFRDWRRWLRYVAGGTIALYALLLFRQPDNDRPWAPDQARLASIRMSDNDVEILNFRHNAYQSETDVEVSYGNVHFQLSDLTQVWFVVQRFTTLEGIAHNFLSFAVDGENDTFYFSVSVEIRRECNEVFSPLRGMYREYELIYVVADERDEIGARTVVRPDDRVFLFPVNATPEQVQTLFRDIASRINKLKTSPEFYHSLLNNCTNNIVIHTYPLTPEPFSWLDPRIVAPGYADRFAWANGLIGTKDQTFEELQAEHRIDEIARQVGITPEFSNHIRKGFPAGDGVWKENDAVK